MGSSCNRTDGRAAFVYGIYALTTHAGFGMYFLLFGLAAIFLFAGANVFPTSKNNKNYIEKQLAESISQMEEYIRVYPDFPVPASAYSLSVPIPDTYLSLHIKRADSLFV